MKFYVEVMTFGVCNLEYSKGNLFGPEAWQKFADAVQTKFWSEYF